MVSSKKRKIKQNAIWRHILLVICGLLLGINIYLVNANNLLGNKLPMPFGYGAAVVLSGSMEPTFSKDDLILVKKTDNIAIGDIVVYQSNDSLVVHRVVSMDGDMVVTKGDANNIEDASFDKSAIKGVVIGCIPSLGVVVNAIKTPAGTVVVLLCAFLLTELSFRKQKASDDKRIEDIKAEIRRLKEEKGDNDEK